GGPCLDWINKEKLSIRNLAISYECSVNFVFFKAASFLVLRLTKIYPGLLKRYIEKKKKKYRLNYNLNFDSFAQLFEMI
ncbi:unnamed protein product, partial [marine sediment metagenome]